MKKISYLQIVVHSVATWILILSLYSFSGLYNIKTLEITQQNGVEKTAHNAAKYGISPEDFTYLAIAKGFSFGAGLLIGLVISIVVSIKNKWSLLNCVLVFLLCVLISRLGIFNQVMRAIISPENISFNLRYKYITQAVLFLIIGLLLFGLKKINIIISEQIKESNQ